MENHFKVCLPGPNMQGGEASPGHAQPVIKTKHGQAQPVGRAGLEFHSCADHYHISQPLNYLLIDGRGTEENMCIFIIID